MSNMTGLSKTEQLRARDGDRCWLCGGKLAFNAEPNSKKAPTLEHLQPSSKGGGNTLDNLVLCHPGCNKQLGDRLKADKLKIRDKRMKARPLQATAIPVAKPAVATRIDPVRIVPAAHVARQQERNRTDLWRKRALIAGAVAIFLLGLLLGRSMP